MTENALTGNVQPILTKELRTIESVSSVFPMPPPTETESAYLYDLQQFGRQTRETMQDILTGEGSLINKLGMRAVTSLVALDITDEAFDTYQEFFRGPKLQPVESPISISFKRHYLTRRGREDKPISFKTQAKIMVRNPKSRGIFRKTDQTDTDEPTETWAVIGQDGALVGDQFSRLASSQKLALVLGVNSRLPLLVAEKSRHELRKRSGGMTNLWND